MTEVILRKRASRSGEVGLFPVDDEGGELLAKIKDGRDVGCDVIQRRNPRHHRALFNIIRFVQTHSPTMADVPTEHLRTALKIATGLVDNFIDTESGRSVLIPRSMSFAAMDQTEFNEFFDQACKVIAHRWMPAGTTPEDVRAELILLIDGPHAIGSRVA